MSIVQTAHGHVEGISRPASLAFYGIPYGANTDGAGRFRPPRLVTPWVGLRPARQIGGAAPQGDHPVQGFAASGYRSEDCLNLNVFTPAADGARRPVLFWIHGGGFTHGAGYEPLYDGRALAERGDVVVVTINYRLGVLGFLDLRTWLPDHGLTVNAGLQDMVAALGWVRDNVAAFGGDPANVTVFGESAGSAAVGALLAAPAARGLFRRAIMESGVGRAATADAAARIAGIVLEELGLTPKTAERILDLPYPAIVEAQSRANPRAQRDGLGGFGPVQDPATLPAPPVQAVRDGHAGDVPVVIGTNRDEIKLFAAVPGRVPVADAELPGLVRALLPGASEDDARRVIEVFVRSRSTQGLPHSPTDIVDAVTTAVRFRVPTNRFALAQRQHQPDTYLYLFTWESPARRGAFGACHALEMPFVFGTLDAPTQDKFAGTGPEAEALSANMMDSWLAFARTGNPAHAGVGAWPPVEAEMLPTMVFGRESGIQSDPLSEERIAVEPFIR